MLETGQTMPYIDAIKWIFAKSCSQSTKPSECKLHFIVRSNRKHPAHEAAVSKIDTGT